MLEPHSSATSGTVDSFVTLFNDDGEEIWTERRGARENDEARAVAFGADGIGEVREASNDADLDAIKAHQAAYGTVDGSALIAEVERLRQELAAAQSRLSAATSDATARANDLAAARFSSRRSGTWSSSPWSSAPSP